MSLTRRNQYTHKKRPDHQVAKLIYLAIGQYPFQDGEVELDAIVSPGTQSVDDLVNVLGDFDIESANESSIVQRLESY